MNEPLKPDADVAADLKQKIAEAVKPLLEVVAAAGRDGFGVHFQIGNDAFGRPALTVLKIVKEF